MTQLLFVYGTLLQAGNDIYNYLELHCPYWGTGTVNGTLYNVGEYPGLVIDKTGYSPVFGKVYEVNEAALVTIDAYEGCGPKEDQPNLFLRKMHTIFISNRNTEAWVYVYNQAVQALEIIPSGDYLEYLEQKKSPGL